MNGKQGDQDAITELFGRHYSSSLRIARGILRSDEESQDAAHWARVLLGFQRLDTFRGDSCFKAWITRIVVNSCLMQRREPRRRFTWVHLEDLQGGRGPESLSSSAPNPERATWYEEINSAFSDAVSRLPKHLRDVYALHAVSGMSLRELPLLWASPLPRQRRGCFALAPGCDRTCCPCGQTRVAIPALTGRGWKGRALSTRRTSSPGP